MSFWAVIRKNSMKICSFPAQNLNQRVISTKSSPKSSSLLPSSLKSEGGSGYNGRQNGGGGSFLDLFENPFISCGLMAAGSSFGLFYWSFLYDEDSFVCFADSGTSTVESEIRKPKYIFRDEYRRKVFFKYEKRLRTQSPLAKVFEYFASFRSSPSGEVFMTPADLMRAVVPVFPPSEADDIRGGFLKGEPIPGELYCAPSEFFMLFDTNGDGLISFPEYIFFITLLSIPETSFSVAFKMFDLDNDGGIDKQEFKKVMNLMRTMSKNDARNRDGTRFGLKAASPVEDGGLVEYFFGKDGQGRLEHGKFTQFLRKLHDEILRLEFAHYDSKSEGTISAKDFALSMVASADMSHINKFLDRVDGLNNEPQLSSIRITFDEFTSFADLRKKLQPFSLAIFSYGKVNGLLAKDDLQRAASQVCNISLTKNIIDMVFYMFDENRDGTLSSTEFLRVLQQRESHVSQSRETGFSGLFSCWLECTKGGSPSKIHL